MTAQERLAAFNAATGRTEPRRLDWGPHKGKTVAEIPTRYLQYMAGRTFRCYPHQRPLVLEARAELERREATVVCGIR